MSADLDPRDADLAARLRALGTQPVDPALQSEHLTALAGVRAGSPFRNALAGRVKVGAGVLAGFLLGATGLTTAGAMGPLQPIASSAVRAVTPLEAPHGKSADAKAKHAADDDEKDGDDAAEGTPAQKIWAAQDPTCPPEGTYRNRGQYLKAMKDGDDEAAFEQARRSDCGKAAASGDDETKAGDEATKADDDAAEADETKGAEETGKPADAGSKGQATADDHKPADAGKPEGAGKADQARTPESTPNATLPDHADDDATDKAPEHAPGTPAKPAEGDATTATASAPAAEG